MPYRAELEIMTFRYLKTLVFDKFLKILLHYLMFLFLKSIISDNYDYSTLSLHIPLSPYSF